MAVWKALVRRSALACALLTTGMAAQAQQPWLVLPALPALPAATVSGPVHVNDIEMWRAEFGPRTGRPLLLLHGGLANSNYFGTVIPYLVQAGFHVIALDTRGHGRSTRSAKPFSYELMASDVVAMMNALHIQKSDVVGWSDGAIVGIELALHDPTRVNRVFAFGANTQPDGLRTGFDQHGVFADFEKRAGLEYAQMSPTPHDYAVFLKQINQMWATQPNITAAQLKTIHTPIVIADGRYDEAIRQSHDRYIAATIPDAHLVILPGVSHFAMLQNPALFARAVLDGLCAPWDN